MTESESNLKINAKNIIKGIIKGHKAFLSSIGADLKLINAPHRINICSGNISILRFDAPHRGVDFYHINVNANIANIPRDPHIPISHGSFMAAQRIAKFCKVINTVNNVIVPIGMAMEIAEIRKAISKDYEHGTTRNTVEAVAISAGGWLGGFVGASGGAAIGKLILPGIGTIIGGLTGALCGGVAGAMGIGKVTTACSDAVGYDIIQMKCRKCRTIDVTRVYKEYYLYKLCSECGKILY